MKKTYQGSCHCGAVRFEADIDLSQGTGKCNCSICAKTRFWGVMVKPDAFRIKAGDEELCDYQFGSKSVHHYFCKNCGVRPFAEGNIAEAGGAFYMVNLACLDDVDLTELVEAPVSYADGLHNNWQQRPDEVRHL